MTKWSCRLLLVLTLAGWTSAAGGAELVFHRSQNKLVLKDAKGKEVESWEAHNNVVKGAQPFPDGTWKFAYHKTHADDGPNSSMGSAGNILFHVTGRTGMGVHSGRANAGGPRHPTEGCIRTTDQAIRAILDLHAKDCLERLTVK